jgi:hypothetical protein
MSGGEHSGFCFALTEAAQSANLVAQANQGYEPYVTSVPEQSEPRLWRTPRRDRPSLQPLGKAGNI